MKLGFWRRTGKILSAGLYSGRRDQGLYRDYTLSIRKDPFQGKEDAICGLIKDFFPAMERNRVLSSIRQGETLFFETAELTCSFEDGLHKLGFFFKGEREEADSRYVFIKTSKRFKEGYYVNDTEAYLCPKCDDQELLMHPEIRWAYDPESDTESKLCVKCGTTVKSLYDMNPKEVKHVETQRRTLADVIEEQLSEARYEQSIDDAA